MSFASDDNYLTVSELFEPYEESYEVNQRYISEAAHNLYMKNLFNSYQIERKAELLAVLDRITEGVGDFIESEITVTAGNNLLKFINSIKSEYEIGGEV